MCRMNVLFLTLTRNIDISSRGIYADLMRRFHREGHTLYIASPNERRSGQPTLERVTDGVHMLGVRTLNLQKTNVIEKGFATLLLESQFKRAIRRHWGDVRFDLVLYSTPPITFTEVVRWVKHRNPQAMSYLLLKDIFPQNAVDLGMFSKHSPLYAYFRRKERALYLASDYIGCMSEANVRFVLQHNPEIDPRCVEIAPNSIELQPRQSVERNTIRQRYGLPTDKPIFIYGGNLGKPQGIPFICQALESCANMQNCHFLIIGNGTEFGRIKAWHTRLKASNITLMQALPKSEYDMLVEACDVGLIFLDYRFTIPNYPSRLLSYLEYHMPIIAATDPNSDIGTIARDNGYGLWCHSNDTKAFKAAVEHLVTHPEQIAAMGERGYDYLTKNYLVEHTYNTIVRHLKH